MTHPFRTILNIAADSVRVALRHRCAVLDHCARLEQRSADLTEQNRTLHTALNTAHEEQERLEHRLSALEQISAARRQETDRLRKLIGDEANEANDLKDKIDLAGDELDDIVTFTAEESADIVAKARRIADVAIGARNALATCAMRLGLPLGCGLESSVPPAVAALVAEARQLRANANRSEPDCFAIWRDYSPGFRADSLRKVAAITYAGHDCLAWIARSAPSEPQQPDLPVTD